MAKWFKVLKNIHGYAQGAWINGDKLMPEQALKAMEDHILAPFQEGVYLLVNQYLKAPLWIMGQAYTPGSLTYVLNEDLGVWVGLLAQGRVFEADDTIKAQQLLAHYPAGHVLTVSFHTYQQLKGKPDFEPFKYPTGGSLPGKYKTGDPVYELLPVHPTCKSWVKPVEDEDDTLPFGIT